MSLRGFGIQTLTTTAQPVFGTTLSAAITGITTDRYTGNTDPRSQPSTTTAVVVNADFFRVGDKVAVGVAGGPYDIAEIKKITAGTPPAATLTLQGLTKTHASGEFVILAIQCTQIRVQPIAVTTAIYIGPDNTVGATSLTVAIKLVAAEATAGTPWLVDAASGGNFLDTTGLWINGVTNTDQYLPSVITM